MDVSNSACEKLVMFFLYYPCYDVDFVTFYDAGFPISQYFRNEQANNDYCADDKEICCAELLAILNEVSDDRNEHYYEKVYAEKCFSALLEDNCFLIRFVICALHVPEHES